MTGTRARKLVSIALLGSWAFLAFNCEVIVPPPGWSESWGPVVPHQTFPKDCKLCHLPDRWDLLRDDFTFDHEKETGFKLEGAHVSAACLRCHNDSGPVKVYAARGCGGCHADPHKSSLGLDCQRCHNEMSWKPTGLIAEHARTTFPLVGAHVATPCERCHERAPVGDFRGAPTACDLCHKKEALSASSFDHIANGATTGCELCHNAAGWQGATVNHSFFPLTAGHGGLACTQCHATGAGFGAVAVDRNCFSCHQSSFQTAPGHVASTFSHDCTGCHSTTQWSLATITHDFFPLTGGHDHLACSDCHTSGKYAKIPADCYSCHKQDFDKAPSHVASGFSKSCGECHSKVSFQGVKVDHSFFPLTEGHADLKCSQCHSSGKLARLPPDCYSCHTQEYQKAPSHVASNFSRNCVDCHTRTQWTGANFDHSFFPLTLGHADTKCIQCHSSGKTGKIPSDCYSCHKSNFDKAPGHTASGFAHDCTGCHSLSAWTGAKFDHSFFPLTEGHSGVNCTQCHTSGQFAKVAADCYSCHKSSFDKAPDHLASGYSHTCTDCHSKSKWQGTNFDHSFFPLTLGHANAKCVQCHTSGKYTTIPSDCYSCHKTRFDAAPGHTLSNFSHDCTGCHSMSSWTGAKFDHSFFPLTLGHAGVDCLQCHPSGKFAKVAADCYSCHKTDFDKAPSHLASGYSHTCTDCHSKSAWTGATFNHTFFPLTLGHAGVTCIKCHTSGVNGKIPADCYSCHKTKFDAAPGHAASGFAHDCTACHSMSSWSGAKFDHSFFPLTEGHTGVPCIKCHTSGVYAKIPSDCYSCHKTDFDKAPGHITSNYSHTCTDCHSKSTFAGATVNHDFFPLKLGHANLKCTQCHLSGTFGPINSDCYACHSADFARGPSHTSLGYPHDCTLCHTMSSWAGSTFRHKFPLTGPHNKTCSTCHLGGNTSDFNCLSCHEHAKTTMDAKHKDRKDYSYTSSACYSCHPLGKH